MQAASIKHRNRSEIWSWYLHPTCQVTRTSIMWPQKPAIISFAIAFTMTSLFTAMQGVHAGIVSTAADVPSDAQLVDVRTAIGANVAANHAALSAEHPAT